MLIKYVLKCSYIRQAATSGASESTAVDSEVLREREQVYLKIKLKLCELLHEEFNKRTVIDVEEIKRLVKREMEPFTTDYDLGEDLEKIVENVAEDRELMLDNKKMADYVFERNLNQAFGSNFENLCQKKIMNKRKTIASPMVEPDLSTTTPLSSKASPAASSKARPEPRPKARPKPSTFDLTESSVFDSTISHGEASAVKPRPPHAVPPLIKPPPPVRSPAPTSSATASPTTEPSSPNVPVSMNSSAASQARKKQFTDALRQTLEMEMPQFIRIIAKDYGIAPTAKGWFGRTKVKTDSQIQKELAKKGVNVSALKPALKTFQRNVKENVERIENMSPEEFDNSVGSGKMPEEISKGIGPKEIGFFEKVINKLCNFFNIARAVKDCEVTSLAEIVREQTPAKFVGKTSGDAPLTKFPGASQQSQKSIGPNIRR
ncbi:MAG: hypothetical protein LBJ09_03225 [Clostridiales bacterium]|jgi:hypothetical protein|nr:hypothetical protein [Clostridiales bacterium]